MREARVVVSGHVEGIDSLVASMKEAIDQEKILLKTSDEARAANKAYAAEFDLRIVNQINKIEKLNQAFKENSDKLRIVQEQEASRSANYEANLDKLIAQYGVLSSEVTKYKKVQEAAFSSNTENIKTHTATYDKLLNQMVTATGQLRTLTDQQDKFNSTVAATNGLIGGLRDRIAELNRLKVLAGSEDDIKRFSDEIDKADAQLKKLEGGSRATRGEFGLLGGVANDVRNSLVAAFGIYELIQYGKELGNNVIKLQANDTALRTTANSLTEYAQKADFAQKMTNKYGLELISLNEQYLKFDQSSKSSTLSLEERNKIFEAFTMTLKTQGVANDAYNRSIKAISDMFSKVTIGAEELKQQLGDNMPGALNIFAKALGVSSDALMKMMKDGKLLADDVLPKVASYLEKSYSTGALEASKNLTSEWNRLKNAVNLGALEFDKANSISGKLSGGLRFVRENASDLWDITKALTVGYGAYLVATTKLTAATTIGVVIDKALLIIRGEAALATAALAGTTDVLSVSQQRAAVAARAFNISLGPIAIAITAAAAAYVYFSNTLSEAEKGTLAFIKANDSQIAGLQKSNFEMSIGVKNVTALAMGTVERKVAIEKLMLKHPQYLGGLDAEKVTNQELWSIYNQVNKQIERKIELIASERLAEQKSDEAVQLRMKLLKLQEDEVALRGVDIFNLKELTKAQEAYSKAVTSTSNNTSFGTTTGGFSTSQSEYNKAIALLKDYHKAVESAENTHNAQNVTIWKEYRDGIHLLKRQWRSGDIQSNKEYNDKVLELRIELGLQEHEEVKKSIASAKAGLDAQKAAAQDYKIAEKSAVDYVKEQYKELTIGKKTQIDEIYIVRARAIAANVKDEKTRFEKIDELAQEAARKANQLTFATVNKQLDSIVDGNYKQIQSINMVKEVFAVAEIAKRNAMGLTTDTLVMSKDKLKAVHEQMIKFIEDVEKKSMDMTILKQAKGDAKKDLLSTLFGFDLKQAESDWGAFKKIFEAGGIGKAIDGAKTTAEVGQITNAVGVAIQLIGDLAATVGQAWVDSLDFSEELQKAQDIFQKYTDVAVEINRDGLDEILNDTSRSWADRADEVAEYVAIEKRLLSDNDRTQIALNHAQNNVKIAKWEAEETANAIQDILSGPKGWVNLLKNIFTLGERHNAERRLQQIQEFTFEQELRRQRATTAIENAREIADAEIKSLDTVYDARKKASEKELDLATKNLDVRVELRNNLLKDSLERNVRELEIERDMSLASEKNESDKAAIAAKYEKQIADVRALHNKAETDQDTAVKLAAEENEKQKKETSERLENEKANKIAEIQRGLAAEEKKYRLEILEVQKNVAIAELQAEVAKLQAKRWFMNSNKIDAAIASINESINIIRGGNPNLGFQAYDPNMGVNTALPDYSAVFNPVITPPSSVPPVTTPPLGTGVVAPQNYEEIAVGGIIESADKFPDKYATSPNETGVDGHEKPQALIKTVAGDTKLAYEFMFGENGKILWRTLPKFHDGTNRVLVPGGGNELKAIVKADERIFTDKDNRETIGLDTTNEQALKWLQIGKKLEQGVYDNLGTQSKYMSLDDMVKMESENGVMQRHIVDMPWAYTASKMPIININTSSIIQTKELLDELRQANIYLRKMGDETMNNDTRGLYKKLQNAAR